MLGADVVPVPQALSLFGGIGEHALGLVAQGKIDGSRNLLAQGSQGANPLADGCDGIVRRQEAVCKCFVFSEDSEEKMLGFNRRRTEFAGFIACEKDDPAGFFGIALEIDALSG